MQASLLAGLKQGLSKMATHAVTGGSHAMLVRAASCRAPALVQRLLPQSDAAVLRLGIHTRSIQRPFSMSRMQHCIPLAFDNRRNMSAQAAAVSHNPLRPQRQPPLVPKVGGALKVSRPKREFALAGVNHPRIPRICVVSALCLLPRGVSAVLHGLTPCPMNVTCAHLMLRKLFNNIQSTTNQHFAVAMGSWH